jgi:lysophospholipase L1-like esterase
VTARFLALGDSYTIGEGVAPAERWPAQLARLLEADGIALEPPEIVAVTGWTTDELMAGIAEARPRGPFGLVSLLIGVNDQYRGRQVEEYRPRFRALLAAAVGFAAGEPGRVLVLSIPDWGVTPFAEGRDRGAIGREIDAFNAAGAEEAERAGARFVDVTAISRRPDPGARGLAADGLHPSADQYGAWALAARPHAAAACGRSIFQRAP